MSESSQCNNYFPLLILLLIPIILLTSSNNNDLLTDEQKLEKQRQIEENRKELNDNLKSFFSKDSIVMLLPLPVMLLIGFSYYNSRYRNNTLFAFLIIFTILYALWYFSDFDFTLRNMPQLPQVIGDRIPDQQ